MHTPGARRQPRACHGATWVPHHVGKGASGGGKEDNHPVELQIRRAVEADGVHRIERYGGQPVREVRFLGEKKAPR